VEFCQITIDQKGILKSVPHALCFDVISSNGPSWSYKLIIGRSHWLSSKPARINCTLPESQNSLCLMSSRPYKRLALVITAQYFSRIMAESVKSICNNFLAPTATSATCNLRNKAFKRSQGHTSDLICQWQVLIAKNVGTTESWTRGRKLRRIHQCSYAWGTFWGGYHVSHLAVPAVFPVYIWTYFYCYGGNLSVAIDLQHITNRGTELVNKIKWDDFSSLLFWVVLFT